MARYVLALTLILCACGSRHAPAAPDAGAQPALLGPAHGRHKTHVAHESIDPHTVECERTSSTWSELANCLSTAPAHSWLHVLESYAYASERSCPACSVTDWWVNPSTGNDSATCVDASHQCKTLAEILARYGTDNARVANPTIHLTADDVAADTFRWSPIAVGSTTGPTLLGVPATIASGSLSGVVPKNILAGAGTIGALQANLGASASTYVGLEICNTTHPSCGFVYSIVTGTVAIIEQPLDSSGNEVDTWANGDSFSILRPPKIYVDSASGVTLNTLWLMGTPFVSTMYNTEVLNCRLDDSLFLYGSSLVTIGNSHGGQSSVSMRDSSVLGGSVRHLTLAGDSGATIGDDAILDQEVQIGGAGGVTIEHVYSTSGMIWSIGSTAFFFGDPSSTGAMYGPSYTVSVASGRAVYCGYTGPVVCSAAASFLGGASLELGGGTNAAAVDLTHDPMQFHPGIPLTIANLDTAVASGGFGGVAVDNVGTIGFVNFNASGFFPSNSPYVAPVANGGTGASSLSGVLVGHGTSPVTAVSSVPPTQGGTGLTALCGNGLGPVSNGSIYTCSAPASVSVSSGTGILVTGGPSYVVSSTGPTSVTGVSGVSCSPTTGAVSCTNTGVTSLVAGTGISVNTPTGVATITNNDPGSGVSVIAGTNISSVGHVSNAWTVNASTQTASGSAGGSLSGTYPNPSIAASGVTNGTYGDSTHVPEFTVGVDGRLTFAQNILIPPSTAGPSSSIDVNSAFDISSTNTTPAVVGSTSITVPAGFLLVNSDMQFRNQSVGALNTTPTWGISVDSSSLYTVSRSVSVGTPGIAGAFSDVGNGIDTRLSISAGTHTIRLLAQSNNALGANTLVVFATASMIYAAN